VKATDALAKLHALGVPVISTADAAGVLGETPSAAQKTLSRLADASLVRLVCRGVWALATVDPLVLPEYLTAPQPSYVSLQTALYQHGMIEQIPAVVYAVSLGRTRQIRTRLGTFSIHRVAPDVFGGFDVTDAGVKLARPEKALFDVLYLSATRDRRFAALPELELPKKFDRRELRRWTARITSPALAKLVSDKLARVLARR